MSDNLQKKSMHDKEISTLIDMYKHNQSNKNNINCKHFNLRVEMPIPNLFITVIFYFIF